jgi:hypothetical protein
MHIEHFVFLSWFPASLESHEQDGEKLSRVTALREATASGDPAMAFRTLPCRRRRSLSAPAKSPAAPIAAGSTSKRVHALLYETRWAQRAPREINHRRIPSFSIKLL